MEEEKIRALQIEGTALCKGNHLWEYKTLGDLWAVQLVETGGEKSKVRWEG